MVDVLTFIEQCENYLKIRPWSSSELVEGWKEKGNQLAVFQKSIYGCFSTWVLPHQDKLRSMVQLPKTIPERFCLRLSGPLPEVETWYFQWRDAEPHPKHHTQGPQEQQVKLSSMVEKDCMGTKDYWQKVGSQNTKENVDKKSPEQKNLYTSGWPVHSSTTRSNIPPLDPCFCKEKKRWRQWWTQEVHLPWCRKACGYS